MKKLININIMFYVKCYLECLEKMETLNNSENMQEKKMFKT